MAVLAGSLPGWRSSAEVLGAPALSCKSVIRTVTTSTKHWPILLTCITGAVQRVAGNSKGGRCRVRLLQEGGDGLFRLAPASETWVEAESALVRVRTAAAPGGAFRLLTLRKRILATELLD